MRTHKNANKNTFLKNISNTHRITQTHTHTQPVLLLPFSSLTCKIDRKTDLSVGWKSVCERGGGTTDVHTHKYAKNTYRTYIKSYFTHKCRKACVPSHTHTHQCTFTHARLIKHTVQENMKSLTQSLSPP